MGMYPTKYCNEDAHSIDMKWLKDHDCLCGWRYTGIAWKSAWGGESSIGFSVDTHSNNPKINFDYVIEKDTDNERKMNYYFPLVKVPCNLGGFRWAFKCGLYINNVYCGRTVYTLYQANSDYFGCRHCMKIVYQTQRWSGKKLEWFGKALDKERKANKLYDSITKWHYRGKPTRKVMRLRWLESQIPPVPKGFMI